MLQSKKEPDSSPVCFIKEPITPSSMQIVSEDIERRKALWLILWSKENHYKKTKDKNIPILGHESINPRQILFCLYSIYGFVNNFISSVYLCRYTKFFFFAKIYIKSGLVKETRCWHKFIFYLTQNTDSIIIFII